MHPHFFAILGTGLLFCSLACVAAPVATLPCTPQTAIDVSKIAPQIIIVGEIHGTEQAPRFVGELICSLL